MTDFKNTPELSESTEPAFLPNTCYVRLWVLKLKIMNIDRFANWLFTACGLLIIIVITGQIIDNLRVVINMTLIMIGFISSGCIVYESVSYIIRKVQLKRKRSH